MPILKETNVLVRNSTTLHRLAKIEVLDDGSLYVVLPREGMRTGSGFISTPTGEMVQDPDSAGTRKSRKTSYHTTGRVHSDHQPKPLFFDPLTRLSSRVDFVGYRVPDIHRLDEAVALRQNDIILELPTSGPIQFNFYVSPISQPPLAHTVTIDTYFRLGIELAKDPLPENSPMMNYFVISSPTAGRFSTQQATEDHAFIEVHGNHGQVVLIPPTLPSDRGVYRVVPVVPMARPPTLRVKLADPSLSVQQRPGRDRIGNVDIRFTVHGPGGLVLEPVKVLEIELDAEIY